MRTGTPDFRPERLVQAREARGLTQTALSELIGRASASISRWESGAQHPEAEPLDALSQALNLPTAFFLSPIPDHGAAPMFFRSMASTTGSLRKRTRVRLRWAQDVSLKLQQWVDLPTVNIPDFAPSDYRDLSDADIEQAAAACREAWGLGIGPLPDVLLLLENAGVVVVKEEVGSAKMDGLSNWSDIDGRPYILVARDKSTCVRGRMDAAHELGHLVLHRNLNQKELNKKADFNEIERQAFHFASALLMPAESFAAEIWSPSLNTFVALKDRWRVAVGAMIKRCTKLGIVSEMYATRLWKYYSARGWRKNEPMDDRLDPEEPRLLNRSVNLLIDEGILSREQLLSKLALSQRDVESLCALQPGFFNESQADIVAMPKIRRETSSVKNGDGEVVPFGNRKP